MRFRWLVFVSALTLSGVAVAEPPHTHEILYARPSGFWTSNRPAIGGAYRYRLLGIGCALALGMGWMMWRFVKKANAERAARLLGDPAAVDVPGRSTNL
ncbi:MAG TPA: hypothetical protein VGM88_17095 [Kofleriaceae bacterium]|jgi:hypothetical protein